MTASDDLTLAGSTALVTGGSKGIGYAIAEGLLSRGAHVMLMGRGADALARAVTTLRPAAAQAGTSVHAVAGDVSAEDDVRRAFDAAAAVQGRPPQVVVNSAGIGVITRLLSLSAREWDEIHRVHVRGAFLVVREAARTLVAAGLPGSVIMITSLNARTTTGGLAHYCAAKAAQTELIRAAAFELGRHAIRLNAIAPGIVLTPMTEPYLQDAYLQAFLDRTPLARLGAPADIADVACFLASRESRWVNGAEIPVDGGAHLHGLHDYAEVLGLAEWDPASLAPATARDHA